MSKSAQTFTAATTSMRSDRDSKAIRTDHTARAIMATETAQRDAKTAKLRAARLAQETAAAEAAALNPPEAKRKKPAKR